MGVFSRGFLLNSAKRGYIPKILFTFAANLKTMPHNCKICGKGFIGKENAINHLVKEHGVPPDKAKKYVYHTTPKKEKERRRMQRMEDNADRLKRVKRICQNGKRLPSGPVYCPICHANHSKSYLAYLVDDDGMHSITVCRNCYKALAADKPQSVFHKSVYDGNYESNK